MATFKFLDLFSGIGGFHYGLSKCGGQCVMASEIDVTAIETYKKNYGITPAGDISEINIHDIPSFDLLCAGFPCQSFSNVGQKGGLSDPRGALIYQVMRILKGCQPKAFLLENVKGLLSHDGGKTIKTIIEGLTDSFEIYCDMKQKVKSDDFEIPGYVMANDGKYYKYNMEIYNVYYCPNNIIIDNFEVKKYPKEKYIVLDYFVLDLKSGDVWSYDYAIDDSFKESMKDCGKPIVYNEGDYKKIIFYKEGKEPIIIILDRLNNIIGLENKNVKKIGNEFLACNKKLRMINLSNVEVIEKSFLENNEELKEINLPKVKSIGNNFLYSDKKLKNIYLPNVQTINDNFLYDNEELKELNLPSVIYIYDDFLYNNKTLNKIDLPKVKYISAGFLCSNEKLEELVLLNVQIVEKSFLFNNRKLRIIEMPNVEEIGAHFLHANETLKELALPNVKRIGKKFLYLNENLQKIYLPKVELIDFSFLEFNKKLKEIDLPNVDKIGSSFL